MSGNYHKKQNYLSNQHFGHQIVIPQDAAEQVVEDRKLPVVHTAFFPQFLQQMLRSAGTLRQIAGKQKERLGAVQKLGKIAVVLDGGDQIFSGAVGGLVPGGAGGETFDQLELFIEGHCEVLPVQIGGQRAVDAVLQDLHDRVELCVPVELCGRLFDPDPLVTQAPMPIQMEQTVPEFCLGVQGNPRIVKGQKFSDGPIQVIFAVLHKDIEKAVVEIF